MMETKVDPTSSVEPGHVQMSTSSIVSTSTPKVSKFGAKSGFVIPKNKLSGSLIPIFRGGRKVEGGNVKEEDIKQVQRKTKWGVDLTQDAAVRKGRALAYQTRLEQITQQLNSGALEIGKDKDLQSPKQTLNQDFARGHTDDELSPRKTQSQKIEALELEKREIIGEILRLDPNYKTPFDYKPLLKEAKVPIPNKAYPGYNVIGLLLGSESNTQKRLEEETGAKVRVHGTKLDAGEKREITLAGITDAQGAYEELYVHVSADTYEKVDAAVALIELLLTPVSGSSAIASTSSLPVAGENKNIYDPSKESPSVMAPSMTNVSQSVLQPAFMPAQTGPPQFHPYLSPWFPTVPSSGQAHTPSGFMPIHLANNPIRYPPSPVGPVNTPQYFGQSPFGSLPRALPPPANRHQLPMQVTQQYPNQAIPQNRPMPSQQPPQVYPTMRPHPNSTTPAPFTAAQPMQMPVSRPPLMLNPQTASAPSGPLSNRPLNAFAPPGNSPGWPTAPPIVSQPLRPNSTTHMVPPLVNTSVRPPQVVSQTTFASRPPQQSFPNNMSGRPPTANFAPPTSFPMQPSTAPTVFSSIPPLVRPIPAPLMVSFSSGSQLSAPMPATTSVALSLPAASPTQEPHPPAVLQTPAIPSASSPFMAQTSMPPPAVAPVTVRPPVPLTSPVSGPAPRLPQAPVQPPQLPSAILSSSSGTMSSFSPVKPATVSQVAPMHSTTVTAPKPVRPSSGDFTFQPLRTHVPASPTPGPKSPSVQNMSQVPLVAPQAPSFRPAVQNSAPAPPVGTQGWPVAANHMVPSQAPVALPPSTAASFSVPASIQPPPRLSFPNPRPIPPMSPATRMGPSAYSPAPQAHNLSPATQMGRMVFSPAPQGPNSSPTIQMGRPAFSPAPQGPNSSPTIQMGRPAFSPAPQGPNSSPTIQMGRPAFSPALQAPSFSSTMSARPSNPMQLHQNQLFPASRPSSFTPPNQQFQSSPLGLVAGAPSSSTGGNQIYDPFSPTSIAPQQGGDPMKARKPDTDAEYEDLMASVGVK